MDSELEVRHLRVLVTLAAEGTFTDAAIRLGLSQSAVSRTLAQFEHIVGAQLVERTTRALALTPAGWDVHREAVAALAAVEAVHAAAVGPERALRLGYAWAAFGRHTTAIIRDWRARRPGSPLEVHRVDERTGGLRTGIVDLAVVRGEVEAAGFNTAKVADETRLAALPAGHRLAGRGRVRLGDLVGEVVAMIPGIGTTTAQLWQEHERPGRILLVANVDEWLTVIASGEAVGVTPESTAFQHPHPGLVFLPVTDAPPVPITLVWPQSRPHPRAAEFAGFVRARYAAGAGTLGVTTVEAEDAQPT